MTSSTAPETRPGLGALYPHPVGPFAGWTHVQISYCSSDFWTGRADVVASDPTLPSFEIAFRGADVLDGVLEELAVGRAALADLPPLADAPTVVLAGTSAGAIGLALRVDRLAARIHAAAPAADVRAVLDSYFPPGGEVLGGGAYSGVFDPVAEAKILAFATSAASADFWSSDAPPDCLAAHADAPHICLEAQHVLMNHVQTPFFIYQDQRDGVVCGGDCEEGLRQQVSELTHIAEDGPWRAEPPVYPVDDLPPGWFAPRCGVHTALLSGADGMSRFIHHLLPRTPEVGARVSYARALDSWLSGVPVEAVRGTRPGPDCPSR